MAYQQKEGQGSLFYNQKQNERQPDLKGRIMIKGIIYNISGWNRISQNGLQYISLVAEEPLNNTGQQYNQQNYHPNNPTNNYQMGAPNPYQQQIPPKSALPQTKQQVVFTKTQISPQAPTYNRMDNNTSINTAKPQIPEAEQEDDLPF